MGVFSFDRRICHNCLKWIVIKVNAVESAKCPGEYAAHNLVQFVVRVAFANIAIVTTWRPRLSVRAKII